jgi:hypothetical protein
MVFVLDFHADGPGSNTPMFPLPWPQQQANASVAGNFPSEGESSQPQENINQEYNVTVKYIKGIL